MIVSLIFVGLLLLSYLAPYVSPVYFWPIAFLGLAYPYLLAINILFVLYWTFRRKKSALIPLLAVAIGYPQLQKFIRIGENNPQVDSEKVVKVLTYNVRSFDRYKWSGNPKTPSEIVQLVKNEKPNIICLQEFRNTTTGLLRLKNLSRKWGTRYYHRSKGNNRVATFSKYPIIRRDEISFGKEHLCRCIFTDLKIGEDTLRVYNLHLESNRFVNRNYNFINKLEKEYKEEDLEEIKDISLRLRFAFIRRAKQANIIREHINKSPYPSIVCGDFNDTPNSYTYNQIRGDFQDAFEDWGKGISTTYNGDFPSFRIDYLLYSKGIKCWDYGRIKQKLSDHYPIYGSFHF